jgi:mycothiol synthase
MNQTDPSPLLPNIPSIPGITFRLFQGEADIPSLQAVRQAVKAADGDIWFPGPDTDPISTCNPLQDCLCVEVDHKMIGFTWLTWWNEADGTQLYLHLGWIVPEWQRKGIGRAILQWQEQRLSQIAQSHPSTGPHMFAGNADDTQPGNRALLLSAGYHVAFTVVDLVCQLPPTPIPLAPLPDGLVIRPVEAEHLPTIHAANEEAFQEARTSHPEESYASFLRGLHWPETDLSLWVVAWDGDQVAGHVISTIDEEGAHTPWVAVRSPWRRRGLGKALMTRAIQRFQERKAQQAEIQTVAENPGRSVHLYESVGYHIVKQRPRYRKPMPIQSLQTQP